MKAIELSINGNRVCLAGSGAQEFTFLQLTLDQRHGDKASVMIAGSQGKMVPIWIQDKPIQEGDEVAVRIVDVTNVDPPVRAERAWESLPCGPATQSQDSTRS